jgi:hypothetical protein
MCVQNLVQASKDKEQSRVAHMAQIEAQKTEIAQAHLAEAANSYKRLLSGCIAASDVVTKRARSAIDMPTVSIEKAAPVAVAPTAAPVVKDAMDGVVRQDVMPCRGTTYVEVCRLLQREGRVAASALGTQALPSTSGIGKVPTREASGHHGLQVVGMNLCVCFISLHLHIVARAELE